MERKAYLVLVSTVLLALILIIGLSAATLQPLYNNQTSFTISYTKPSNYWRSARFNSQQGGELAFFTFTFRTTNQSQGPVVMTVEFGPNPGAVYLDSVKLTFTSDNLSWPEIGFRVPDAGTLFPTEISREDQQQVTINYQNLRFYGQGTNKLDLWFGVVSLGPFSNDHTVILSVDLTAHVSDTILIGQSYSGRATFRIVVEPNGLIFVSDK